MINTITKSGYYGENFNFNKFYSILYNNVVPIFGAFG